MSKFKPGDRVRYIDESPNAAVRTVIGPRPDDPSFVVLWTQRGGGYLAVKVDELELAPDPRQEAIDKAVVAIREYCRQAAHPFVQLEQYELARALADAGLLKEPSDD